MPHGAKAREKFAAQIAADGYLLLGLLSEQQQPNLLKLEKVETLRKVWQQHYTRSEAGEARWRVGKETLRAAVSIESPYDTEAKYSRKDVTRWTGYKVHLSETCDEHLPHLITNVHTTVATTQDVASTAEIQKSLCQKQLLPLRHLVDAGYIDADLLIQSADQFGIELFGPTRSNSSWQSRTGGIDATQFQIDWNNRQAICPAGNRSLKWLDGKIKGQYPRQVVRVQFSRKDCLNCNNRDRCVRSKVGGARQLLLPSKEIYLALKKARSIFSSSEGQIEYRQRAGIEEVCHKESDAAQCGVPDISGLLKPILQEVATATAINLLRTINFLNEVPRTKTRVSRFARLAH